MSTPKIILLVIFALLSLVTVTQVGKQKAPTTPGIAAAVLVINGLLAYLVVIA